jgi:Uri superfamily endonuclease
MAALFDTDILHYKTTLFVPASGAASRMFKSLFAFIDDENETCSAEVQTFLDNISQFAFFDTLKQSFLQAGIDFDKTSAREKISRLLSCTGLNYGDKPKGLLLFHRYPEGNRLALEEHLVEIAQYGKSDDGKTHIHFTVSPEHKQEFLETIKQVQSRYEEKFNVRYDITFSQQKLSTDTIAVNPDNTPFRNSDGSLLFRPGGHGALIENLNELDTSIIFIKNIDNIVPDRLKSETVLYKKALCDFLISIVKKIKFLIEQLSANPEKGMTSAIEFIKDELMLKIPNYFESFDEKERVHWIVQYLNRPIRVCGMVKNEGEPGGGPFFVRQSEDGLSLQIVESSQIDMSNPQQAIIARQATHFNPVDLVCYIKDFKGKQFNLQEFVDPKTGFISEKSKDGKLLKAQELPGLWNGAMAHWITLFVEVPLITFNPVKTVNDLLRKEHQ